MRILLIYIFSLFVCLGNIFARGQLPPDKISEAIKKGKDRRAKGNADASGPISPAVRTSSENVEVDKLKQPNQINAVRDGENW
jgi:hypothetical protein